MTGFFWSAGAGLSLCLFFRFAGVCRALLCLSVWQVLRCACVPVFTGLQVLGVCCVWCRCVRLSVGVCALLRCACGALSVPVMAGFALCAAVGVCRCCAVVCALMLRCGAVGVLFSIKTRVYSDFRMYWIICGLSIDYMPIILCIISPLPMEIIEIMPRCFSGQKEGFPHIWKAPPSKF